MNNKGISPLIATVLIIGFTVALAAIIITWGSSFVQRTQRQVGEQADFSIVCSQLDFDIISANCSIKPPMALMTATFTSNSAQTISDIILRAYDENNDVGVDQSALGAGGDLVGFGSASAKQELYILPSSGSVKIVKVEAIAKLTLQNQGERACQAPIVQYIPPPGNCGN